MSWPQWQPPAQPAMPMINTAMPIGIQYTAEQWQNWQQWAQWQQQYQQWHQQYGADYQKSLTAMANMGGAALGAVPPIINTTAPPPLPNDTKPPPPPEEPAAVSAVNANIQHTKPPPIQNTFPKSIPFTNTTNVQGYNSMTPSDTKKDTPATGSWQPNTPNKSSINITIQDYRNNKRPSNASLELNSDSKKNKLDWQPPPGIIHTEPPPLPQTPVNEKLEDLSDPEKKFMKQFSEWEAQFNKWKEQNQDHPDKAQYRDYEKKWEAWRNQLLDRRDQMRKKRLGLLPNTSVDMHPNTNAPQSKTVNSTPGAAFDNLQSPNDRSINPINSSALATLFKTNINDGIPGLDLVDAPPQPDDVPTVGNTNNELKSQPKPPGLNLDALSKNLNSILGDQKLLSMLNLVTQNANLPPQKTEAFPIPVKSLVPPLGQNASLPLAQNAHPPPVQNAPGGITLAPKIAPLDDQASNWSTNTNLSGNSNSTTWNQDAGANNANSSLQGRRLGGGGTINQNYKGGPNSSFEQSPNSGYGPRDNNFAPSDNNFGSRENNFGSRDNNLGPRDNNLGPRDNNLEPRDNNLGPRDTNFGPRDNNFASRDNNLGPRDNNLAPRDNSFGRSNSFSSNHDYPRESQYEYDHNEGRFMDENLIQHAMNQRESSFDGYVDDYWHSNNGPNLNDANINMPPAPPTITDFDDILQIDKVVNYDHKPQKQGTCDVKVFSPHIFDYRHKLVTRIPYPERPKWLNEAFHNIPEFAPPIVRTNIQYSRYPPNYHPASGPMQGFNRYDTPGPNQTYNRYDDYNTFSRRPPMPMDHDQSNSLSSYPGPNMDKEKQRSKFSNSSYDYSDRQQIGKWGRDSRERRDSRGRDFDTGKSRNSRDRERDTNTNSSANPDMNKDVKADRDTFIGGNGNGNFYKGFSNVGNKLEPFAKTKSDSDFNSRAGHCVKTSIDDILNMPGRANRPPRIVIILRGPPGSGKTFLAKQIKDKEAENGGSAPRILSLDDYFMVEQEREVIEDCKTVKVKDMVYEYEECMEAAYRQSLLKTFKKTITDGYFSFIIVDNVNDKVKNFDEMWSFAKQNGFQVYVSQLELDVQICTKRNTHGRSEVEIQHIVSGWEELPSHYGILDVTNLIQAGAIAEVEMEEINSPNDDFDDDEIENEEQACSSSKWDNFECSIDNLAKLDGINKPLRSAGTMEDYLQLDEWTDDRSRVYKPGQKRVRWADLEERKEQEKMRAIGFVVGHTDWGRMMDPSQGSSALIQTKYIERVGVRKVNTN